MDIKRYFKRQITRIDGWLDELLPSADAYPQRVHEAMRYAVLNGGKRIRSILAVACAEAVGGRAEDAKYAACAIEMIHAYSLVHDDLPCMDDDDMRRGVPTVHKKYDEATAVLTGDALLTCAAEILSRTTPAKRGMRLLSEIMQAAGTRGMLGGQVVDIEYQQKEPDLAVMDYINIHKTGKLIAVSCLGGAIAGGATKKQERQLLFYGEHLGLVFQLIDDIIDGDGYVKHFGERACLERADDHIARAKEMLNVVTKNKRVLCAIAEFVLTRRV